MSEAAERWATVKRICNEVAETAESERAALLDALTKDQPELREDVGSLLDACREAEAALPVPDARTFQGWFAGEGATDRHLGPYRIVREIASGGMGVVYEAEQDEPKRRVALKVLPFAAVLDQIQIARFRNEAQAAAQLQAMLEANPAGMAFGAPFELAYTFVDSVAEAAGEGHQLAGG